MKQNEKTLIIVIELSQHITIPQSFAGAKSSSHATGKEYPDTRNAALGIAWTKEPVTD